MQTIDIYQIDAFTHERFRGNPAAVCLLTDWLPDEVMQSIAAENNLSETAFLKRENDFYHIRWMAPEGEVDLCGHATLASACAVIEFIDPAKESILFKSRGRDLKVRKQGNEYELQFPRFPVESYDLKNLDAPMLDLCPKEAFYGNGTLVLVLENQDKLKRANPDIPYLKDSATFLSLTAIADPDDDYHFSSRFFAPSVGIDEDPVTGSVHCLLAPLWSSKLGNRKLKASQLSKRGGRLSLRCEENHVFISGGAVPYLSGKIILES